MTYSDILRIYEKKNHIIKKTNMTDEQKAEVIEFFNKHREQESNISGEEWNKPETLTYERFKQVIEAFNNRNTKSKANKIANKKGIEGITEGKDYLDFGEITDENLGTFHAYVPLSWLGAKTIESSKVKPVNSNKDSASWCIGYSESDSFWNKYFFRMNTAFLILCGEGIPTKKVCFEIKKSFNYKVYTDFDKASEEYQKAIDSMTIWDYYDGTLDFYSFNNEVSRISKKEYPSTDKLIFPLLQKAKELSDRKRELLKEEFSKPKVLLKSTYTDRITAERATTDYKTYLNVGIQLLRYLDAIFISEETKELGIDFILHKCTDSRNKIYMESLVDWFKKNANEKIENSYVPSIIHPEFILSDNYMLGKDHESFLYDICAIGDSMKIIFQLQRCGRSIEFPLYKKYLGIRVSEQTPIGKRECIADFDEYKILTVKDLIAFLGEELVKATPYQWKDCTMRITSSTLLFNTEISEIITDCTIPLRKTNSLSEVYDNENKELFKRFKEVLKKYIKNEKIITSLYETASLKCLPCNWMYSGLKYKDWNKVDIYIDDERLLNNTTNIRDFSNLPDIEMTRNLISGLAILYDIP